MVELKNYKTNQGFSCQLSCIRDIFAYYDVDIDESDIYCLGHGFRYIYNRDLYEQDIKIHSDIPKTIFTFLDNYNITYKNNKDIDNESAEKILIESIKNNTPIMIALSNKDLNYDAEFKHHSEDMGHIVTVTGIDIENDRIKISDGFIPSSPPGTYQGWLDYSKIKNIRMKWNNWYLVIDSTSILKFRKEMDQIQLLELLESALQKSIMELLQGGMDNNTFYGINALEQYYIDLKNLSQMFPENFSEKLYQQNIYLKVEGFIENKQYLYQTVQKLFDLKQEHKLFKISQKINENQKKWLSYCLMLVKLSLENRAEKIINLADRFKDLYQEEIEIYYQILNYLD